MSTSLLYHAFGIRGYVHVRTEYPEGRVVFTIRQEAHTLRCSSCDSAHVIRRGEVLRQFRTCPVGGKRVTVVLPVPRVECRSCGLVRQVKVEFARERHSYTRSFGRYAVELSKHMTIQDVAHHLGVSWDVVKEIVKRYLKRHFGRPKLGHLKQIAIDEICVGKGQRYLTVVLDLATGAVVFVGQGRGGEALDRFWRKLKKAHACIQAVATDMSPAYIAAVKANLPDATLVFDHFHVLKLFNEKLSNLRRDLYREATDLLHKQVLKGTRWLLLKNPENLDDRHNEHDRLAEALRINQPLATAYYLKEDLRQLWYQLNKTTARLFLQDWIRRADVSGVRMLKDFAKTLAFHREGILAYYDFRISCGPLEATNNKIKTMQRQAYGYRDRKFFTLKIYALHQTKYALVG